MGTTEKLDVIIIDTPPPVEQPASSLLYSVELYELLKLRTSAITPGPRLSLLGER